uniref:Vitellogenin domain-containing protein n=1 Tax=Electrophorus electricus TaxID=8005 RepID=A0A4W4F1N1_ELEEL
MTVGSWAVSLKTQLVTPIKFEYSNGVVGKVFAPARVSSTVLNLHRGILNIFQLNLKQTQNVYELHEDGTQGVCKTHYMIREQFKPHQIAVTKSKDLTDCHERVIKDIGLAYTEKCAKFLGDALPPAIAIIARAVRTDRVLGYQLAAYVDKSTSRVQIVLSSIVKNYQWKICADGVLPSKHKIAAKLAWGKDCQEYSACAKVETGLQQSKLAARLKLKWDRLPEVLNILTIYTKRASDYILMVAPLVGISAEKANNKGKEIALTVVLSDQDSLNIILKCPKMTLSRKDVPLLISLPIGNDRSQFLNCIHTKPYKTTITYPIVVP